MSYQRVTGSDDEGEAQELRTFNSNVEEEKVEQHPARYPTVPPQGPPGTYASMSNAFPGSQPPPVVRTQPVYYTTGMNQEPAVFYQTFRSPVNYTERKNKNLFNAATFCAAGLIQFIIGNFIPHFIYVEGKSDGLPKYSMEWNIGIWTDSFDDNIRSSSSHNMCHNFSNYSDTDSLCDVKKTLQAFSILSTILFAAYTALLYMAVTGHHRIRSIDSLIRLSLIPFLFISIHSILTIGYRQSAVHVADDIVREHLLETQTGEVSGYFDWGAFMVLFGLIGCGASLGFLFTAARYERMLQSQEATSLLGNNRGPAVAGSYGANSYGGASQYENQPQVRPQTDQPAQPQPHQQQV